MFKLTIICIGKFKEEEFKGLEMLYMKRLRPFAKINLCELVEVKHKGNPDVETYKQREADLILRNIPKNSIVVALDEHGQEKNSKDFAMFFERLGQLGHEIVFIIGGAYGLHTDVLNFSNYKISLSKLTFTHNFARVILEEQIYRACMIIEKKPYHHQ